MEVYHITTKLIFNVICSLSEYGREYLQVSNMKQTHNNPIRVYRPFERIGIDLTMFIHYTDNGQIKRQIFTVIDYFLR